MSRKPAKSIQQERRPHALHPDVAEGLRQWLPYLSEGEAEVVALRFGLHSGCQMGHREIAERLGKSTSTVSSLLSKAGKRISMRMPPAQVPDVTPLSEAEAQGMRECFGLLTRTEQRVVTLRYGLDGDKPMSAIDVAERLGVTRSAVFKTLERAAERIRLERPPAGGFEL